MKSYFWKEDWFFFLRDRKSNKKKVAEKYCWAMTGRGGHVAGDQWIGVQI
jgi:hypothetical protein